MSLSKYSVPISATLILAGSAAGLFRANVTGAKDAEAQALVDSAQKQLEEHATAAGEKARKEVDAGIESCKAELARCLEINSGFKVSDTATSVCEPDILTCFEGVARDHHVTVDFSPEELLKPKVPFYCVPTYPHIAGCENTTDYEDTVD